VKVAVQVVPPSAVATAEIAPLSTSVKSEESKDATGSAEGDGDERRLVGLEGGA